MEDNNEEYDYNSEQAVEETTEDFEKAIKKFKKDFNSNSFYYRSRINF